MKNTHGVTVVERSGDSKLSKDENVSVSWVGQASCPASCSLKDGGGCYAELGKSGITTRRLNDQVVADGLSTAKSRTAMAKAEVTGIRGLSGTRQLRVHVVGDCATPASARLIGAAMVAHTARAGQASWTYTHGWREIARSDWRGANVLASCHTAADVQAARKRGYAASFIVPKHPTNKVRVVDGETVIPCPAQFKHKGVRVVTCEECTLCKRPEWLLANRMSVGFQPDAGSEKKIIALTLAA